MKLTGKKNIIMLVIAILWLACWGLAVKNQYLLAMEVSLLLMALHLVLGASHNDVFSKKLLVYPTIPWIVLWGIGFYLAHANAFKQYDDIGQHLFGGFHPSFGPVVYLYWIGGMATLAFGFYIQKDSWLTQEQWDGFKTQIAQLKGEKEAKQ